jgi:hypothetical protein
MSEEYDEYDILKSAHYTREMITLARRRWGGYSIVTADVHVG